MIRFTILLLCLPLALFPALGRSETPSQAKARQALTLAAAARMRAAKALPCGIKNCTCGCADGGHCGCFANAKKFCACTGQDDCICSKGTCDCPNCGNRAKAGLTYSAAYAKAVKEGMPLVVWVGQNTIPEWTLRDSDLVCCTAASVVGYSQPGVVVGVSDGVGGITEIAVLPPNATRKQVYMVFVKKAARDLEATANRIEAEMRARQAVPAYRPMSFQPVFRRGGGSGC